MEAPVPMTMEEYTRRVEEGKTKLDKYGGSYMHPSQIVQRHLFPWIKHVAPQCVAMYFGGDAFTFELKWAGKRPNFSAHPAMVPVPFDPVKHALRFGRSEDGEVRVYQHGIWTLVVN
jgi:hypothetical protein